MSEINVFSCVHKNIDLHKHPAIKLYNIYVYIYTHTIRLLQFHARRLAIIIRIWY